MQTFIDTANGRPYVFEDDVIVVVADAGRVFLAPHGVKMKVPLTLVPGELPAPSVPTLDSLKAAKLATINAKAQAAIAPYTKGYPQFEIDTWPVQSSEAAAYAIDTAAPTPFCDIAAAQRGIDRVEFIGKVQAKVALFTQLSATVAGYRQGLEDQITAITDPETAPAALDAIVWTSPV